MMKELKLSQEKPLSDEILKTCNLVLSNSEMLNFFQTQINKFGLFLKHLFIAINSKETAENTLAHNCILNAIDTLMKINKQYIDKNELAETFLNYILSPLCAIIDPNCKDRSNRIGAEAHKCMQQILFGKGRYAEYKEYFGEKKVAPIPNKLFASIVKHKGIIEANETVNMIHYVFRAAVGSYKTDSSILDSFLRSFVHVAGNLKIVAFNLFIEYLSDVALEYGNEVDGTSLTDFLAGLIDESLKAEEFSDQEYSFIGNIISLNPLILENKLLIILDKILLKTRKTAAQKHSYLLLMIGILDASSRLRREQKVIPWILLSLHKALARNKDCMLSEDQILPREFILRFGKFASSLNSSQSIAMLRSLTFHLKLNCVEEYGIESKNHVYLMTECTSSLLVAFIDGITIFEHTVPLPMKQKFVASLSQLGEVLSVLKNKILSTGYDRRIMVVLFKIGLSWVEIQLCLNNYEPDCGAGNLSFPIPDDDLQHLVQMAEDFGDIDCTNASVIYFVENEEKVWYYN